MKTIMACMTPALTLRDGEVRKSVKLLPTIPFVFQKDYVRFVGKGIQKSLIVRLETGTILAK